MIGLRSALISSSRLIIGVFKLCSLFVDTISLCRSLHNKECFSQIPRHHVQLNSRSTTTLLCATNKAKLLSHQYGHVHEKNNNKMCLDCVTITAYTADQTLTLNLIFFSFFLPREFIFSFAFALTLSEKREIFSSLLRSQTFTADRRRRRRCCQFKTVSRHSNNPL